jgi:hypothetical protein
MFMAAPSSISRMIEVYVKYPDERSAPSNVGDQLQTKEARPLRMQRA